MTKILDEIVKGLPKEAEINEACFEGANIILYTKSKDFFVNGGEAVKKIVDDIKKRIELRADISIYLDQEKTKKIIEELVPKEAGETNIIFDPQRSRIIIEAEKPGIAIGKQGSILKEIKQKTLWTPSVRRIPSIPSPLIENIRQVLYENNDYRKKFLNKIGKRIYDGWTRSKRNEWVRIISLGGAREVGRSCFLLQTPESNVLLDCGINVAASNSEMFPVLDVPEFNIQDLDAVIVSHPHLDHIGTVPYLFKMGYRGPVYCTSPTRDVGALLCLDYIDLSHKDGEDGIYSSTDVKEFVKHTVCLEYEEVSDITPDIRITFYNAGHNLGSALTHLHIGNGLTNLVYSLDGNEKIVIVDKDNNIQRINIEEAFNLASSSSNIKLTSGDVEEVLNVNGLKTYTFNKETLKTELVPITSFVRHPINEELYEIKTESGRKIKVTKSHSLFTIVDGQVCSVMAEQLKRGAFIIGANKIEQNSKRVVVNLLKHKKYLAISIWDDDIIKNIISEHEKNFSKLISIDRLHASEWLHEHYKGAYLNAIAKKFKVHSRRIRRVLNTLEVQRHPEVGCFFPHDLEIDENFARFLGYYVSEGYSFKSSQAIGISNTKLNILKDCYNIINDKFGIKGNIREKDDCILFSSKQLKYLVCKILKCGRNAYEKRVPMEILSSDKEVVSNFLYGYFSGDGGIRDRKNGREINAGSKNKELIQDISFLLLKFNLVPTLEFNKSSEMYNLHIYNAEKIRRFLDEVGINNDQLEELEKSLKKIGNKASFDMRIPSFALSKKAQADISLTVWRNALTCGKAILKKKIFGLDDKKIINSDIMFDKIKSVKKVNASGKYVYDFRINRYENFIAGEGFLFAHNTGDFNYETSNLLAPAETQFPRVESIMMESTYGSRKDIVPARKESEEVLLQIIKETADRQGKVLMPVLGVGRSQEIMIILERAMREGRLPNMPVYIQGMVWDVTAIHTAYPDYFNNSVKRLIFQKDNNPFLSDIFKRVASQKEMQEVKDSKGPYIVMATSGMLTGGASLSYFKHFAENPKNTLILTCYQGAGSLGRKLEEGERELLFVEGGSKKQEITKVLMGIYSIKGFSGHSSFTNLMNWVSNVEPRPRKVICIHGEQSKCIELASNIYQTMKVETSSPKLLEGLRLR
jgi:predicted metal-dependent RNase/intein/homing endonuclease